jgi:hypothetical protein
MKMLAKDASKKGDQVFRGVHHILILMDSMLSVNPDDRPTAQEVQERLYAILSEYSGLGQKEGPHDGMRERIHCETREIRADEWDFGFDELRLASQRAAAAACASVAPVSTLIGNISSGRTVIYPEAGVEKLREIVQSPISPLSTRSKNEREGDRASVHTKTSRSSEGKSKVGSSNGLGKVKPKPKAWQAPVYAGQ